MIFEKRSGGLTTAGKFLWGSVALVGAWFFLQRRAQAAPPSTQPQDLPPSVPIPTPLAPPFDATALDGNAVSGSETLTTYRGLILQTWQDQDGSFRGQALSPCGILGAHQAVGLGVSQGVAQTALLKALQASVDFCLDKSPGGITVNPV